jgi:hypothetical protein
MKINSNHLIRAVIVLSVLFLISVDAQNTPPKSEPQKWEYFSFGVREDNVWVGESGAKKPKTYTTLCIGFHAGAMKDAERKLPKGRVFSAIQPRGYKVIPGYQNNPAHSVQYKAATSEILEMLGNDGWEIASFSEVGPKSGQYETHSDTYYIFKRPKQ